MREEEERISLEEDKHVRGSRGDRYACVRGLGLSIIASKPQGCWGSSTRVVKYKPLVLD
jgi:hypothetical protein